MLKLARRLLPNQPSYRPSSLSGAFVLADARGGAVECGWSGERTPVMAAGSATAPGSAAVRDQVLRSAANGAAHLPCDAGLRADRDPRCCGVRTPSPGYRP